MGFLSKAWKKVKNIAEKGLNIGTLGLYKKLKSKLDEWLNPEIEQPGILIEKEGTDHAIPVVYGTRKVPSIKVFKQTTDERGGAKNESLHIICIFCEGEVDAIEEVFFNDISENDKDSNFLSIERHLGADNQAASAGLQAAFPNIWTGNHKLSGLCYIYVKLKKNKEQNIWQGEPKIFARIRGKKITDPRTDIIAYSENPAIILYDYLLSSRYGKGARPERFDLKSVKDCADFCDIPNVVEETITEQYSKWQYRDQVDFGSMTEQEWEALAELIWQPPVVTNVTRAQMTCNAVIDTNIPVFKNVRYLLSAMRGTLPPTIGKIRLSIESDGAPVFEFNDDNLIDKSTLNVGSKNTRFNSVVVRYPSKNLNYEMDEVTYPTPDSETAIDWLSDDNGVVLTRSFTFSTITNKAEALQMAQLVAHRSRQDLSLSIKANITAMGVEPGDIVGVTDSERGWASKPFRVQEKVELNEIEFSFKLNEHQDSIYPWAITDTSQDIPDTYFSLPDSITAPTGLAFTEEEDSNVRQGFIGWDDANNTLVSKYEIEVYQSTTLIFSRETSANQYDITTLAKGNYTVKVYSKNALYRSDAVTLAITVTTSPMGSRFVWKKYADSALGLNLTDNPTGKSYVGWAYNKDTQIESEDASDYKWSLMKGSDGDNGQNGDDGASLYTWVKYADDITGAGLSNDDTKLFTGHAYNKASPLASSNAADYVWHRNQGADGQAGQNGDDGINGDPGIRGSKSFYRAIVGSTWLDSEAFASIAAMSLSVVTMDQVTLYNEAAEYSETKFFDGAVWQVIDQIIDGNLLVNGTIGASKLAVTSLSAITANVGSLVGGELIGARIATANSGARAELSDTDTPLAVYDNNGVMLLGTNLINAGANVELFINGRLANNSIPDADFLSAAGLVSMRNRLGLKEPSVATGGVIEFTGSHDSLVGDHQITNDSVLSGGRTLKASLQGNADYTFQTSINPGGGVTATFNVQFYKRTSANNSSWSAWSAAGAAHSVSSQSSISFIDFGGEPGFSDFWRVQSRINLNVSIDIGTTSELYYQVRAVVTKTAGYSQLGTAAFSSLTSFVGDEPLNGDVIEAHFHDWNTEITNKPTSLAGYSIGDAIAASAANTTGTDIAGNKLVKRHSSGYIFSNYFNMTANQTTATPTRIAIETSTDKYLRWQTLATFASKLPQVPSATWADSVDVNTSSSASFYNMNWHNGDTMYSCSSGGGATYRPSDGFTKLKHGYLANSRLKHDTGGKIKVISTGYRRAGMYGYYDSYKTGHIWSMGDNYVIPDNGANFGNLYGLAYKHTNNTTGGTMAAGHQMVWCQNGVGKSAMGTNIWTSGTVSGANVTWTSDERIKTNIERIDDASAIRRKWTGNFYTKSGKKSAGLIAQEVQANFKRGVSVTDTELLDSDGNKIDDLLTLNLSPIIGVLVESANEDYAHFQRRMDECERELNALKVQLRSA